MLVCDDADALLFVLVFRNHMIDVGDFDAFVSGQQMLL